MCHNLEGASFHHKYFGPKLSFWLSNVAAIREPPKVESSLVHVAIHVAIHVHGRTMMSDDDVCAQLAHRSATRRRTRTRRHTVRTRHA